MAFVRDDCALTGVQADHLHDTAWVLVPEEDALGRVVAQDIGAWRHGVGGFARQSVHAPGDAEWPGGVRFWADEGGGPLLQVIQADSWVGHAPAVLGKRGIGPRPRAQARLRQASVPVGPE